MEDVPYGRILREGWSIIVILAVLGVLAAWGVTRVLPQTYTASSTLMLQVDSREASLFERNQFSMARIQTYPALVDSQQVIDGVRADLSLSEQEYSDGDLRARLSAENTDDTVLLKVVAEASTAELSADIANSAAGHLSDLVEDTENIDGDERYEVSLGQVLLAVAPASPTAPHVTAITGLGLIGGLAIGAITAVYRTTTNRRLLTVADVRRASGLAVVGQIPRSRRQSAGPDQATLVAFQEAVGNVVTLGGSGRGLYAVVPASNASLDDDTVTGLLGAYLSMGARACVVDVRATPIASSTSQPVEALFDPERVDGGDGRGSGVIYAAEMPVSSRGAVKKLMDEVETLGGIHDAVVLVCDSSSSMLLESLVQHGAGVIVAVRHNATQAAALYAVVTRQQVQGIRPIGVLMTHTSRGSTENVAETWRVSDREALDATDFQRNGMDGIPVSLEHGVHAASGRGRRAG